MKKYWYKLDTAALIFPAIRNRKWANLFRVSARLHEDIDPEILQKAVIDLKKRFPTFYVRLCPGLFWYRLEESKTLPEVSQDYAYPLVLMPHHELRKHCMRIRYYRNRVALEYFHSVTDGTGAILFLKNLIRRYLFLKNGVEIPDDEVFLNLEEAPKKEELEDSFLKNSSGFAFNDKDENVYKEEGDKNPRDIRLITGTLSADTLHEKAHEFGCSVTVFLAAVMAEALIGIQNAEKPKRKQKPVKIGIPINLRKLYGSRTIRNFVLVLNIGVDPRQGEYTLQELCDSLKHQLLTKNTPQVMAGKIAENTLPRESIAVRLAPLPIKNLFLNIVYNIRGERGLCISLSNIGVVSLPEEIGEQVQEMEFICAPAKQNVHNCGILTYRGKTKINLMRDIERPELERRFFSRLVELGIPVEIESNEGKSCTV